MIEENRGLPAVILQSPLPVRRSYPANVAVARQFRHSNSQVMFQVYSSKFPALYLGQIARVYVRPRDHIVHRVQALLLRRERLQRVRVELVFHAVHHSDEIEYTLDIIILHRVVHVTWTDVK